MVAKITVLKARTGAGGTYRAVTDEHDVTYLCYDKTLWHHLEPGSFFYAEFDVATKRDGTGSYNRIIGISKEEPKAKEVAPKPSPEKPIEAVVTPLGDAKNRAFSLSYSKDIAVAEIDKGKETTPAKTIELAKRFCRYLETGE